MAKYKVTIGEEFVVDGVEITNVKSVERLAAIDGRRRRERQQAPLAYGVLGLFSAAFVASAVIGWYDGSYDELLAVWVTGHGWATFVIGRFFKKG